VIRVPGGKPAAHALSILGFATTLFTIALSVLPPPTNQTSRWRSSKSSAAAGRLC